MGRLNLVYFVRPIPRTAELVERYSGELRYSLRSVAANLVGLGEVHVFGGTAPWFSEHVHVHRVRQARTKHENTWTQWRAIADACRHDEVPEHFLLMNDDFFLNAPVTQVPAMVHGTVDAWIEARRFGGARAPVEVMTRTRNILDAERGAPSGACPSFEVHVPLPVNRTRFAGIVPRLAPYVDRYGRIAKRTAYANLAGLAADVIELDADVKVRDRGEQVPAGPWWSTSDDVFRVSRTGIGKRIRDAFPLPSRFEL